jgi:hypothetical protein
MTSPYRLERVRRAYVEVVGEIWMPCTTAAYRYELSVYDLENIGDFTRENVDAWLGTHAGDFQSVADFHAVCGDAEIPWESEESELAYGDCMYPAED